jgi:hypothetical protein
MEAIQEQESTTASVALTRHLDDVTWHMSRARLPIDL